MKRLIVAGGGEHARVVIEAARVAGWDVIGFTDPDSCSETIARLGIVRLGLDARALEAEPDAAWVLGIGSTPGGVVRARVASALGARGARWATVAHPSAVVSPTATLGPGVVVLAAAVVGSGARIGDHSIVNDGAVVEHDCVLGAHVHIAPGARLGGGADVGAGAYVGLGACVRDHVRVGAGAVVGMGAVVVGDVIAGDVVLGNPARSRGSTSRT